MPDRPNDGGRYFIQNKRTGKQLGLPNSSQGGAFEESHIQAHDRGVPWLVQGITFDIEGTPILGGGEAFWLSAWSVWPWSTGGDEHEGWGRLDSNHERQVYGHPPNDGLYQVWTPRWEDDNWVVLANRATHLVLDGDDDIYTFGPNSGDYQRWGFFAAPDDPF